MPVRELVDVFAATARSTVPVPVRPVPFAIVMYELRLFAVQAQFGSVVTLIVTLPAADGIVTRAGVTLKVQDAAFDCVTVKVAPATVSVPIRLVVPVFAATL
jgi:hypothetical protein